MKVSTGVFWLTSIGTTMERKYPLQNAILKNFLKEFFKSVNGYR
jgi:hypothetical protein